MKKKNIVLSLFVGVAALSALASCGKKKGDKKDDVTTTSEVSQSTSTSEVSQSTTSGNGFTGPFVSETSGDESTTTSTESTVSTIITYNLASGSMESDETVTVEYNPTTGLDYEIISEIPTYAGYRFAGWKISGDDTIYQAGDTYHIDEEHESPIFVAQWVKQVSVSLYSNKPFGSIETISVDENGSFVVEAPEERENYTFLGYASSLTATEAAHKVGDTVTVGSTSLSLYGVWAGDNVKLKYNLYNNTYPMQNKVPEFVEAKFGETVTLPNPDLSEYGLTFLGWSKNYYSPATPTDFTVDFKGGETILVNELNVAEGESTKIIIPSNMEGIAAFGTVINEMINKDKKEK